MVSHRMKKRRVCFSRTKNLETPWVRQKIQNVKRSAVHENYVFFFSSVIYILVSNILRWEKIRKIQLAK